MKQLRRKHNKFRESHCVGKLTNDRYLADYARDWALWLRENNQCKIAHRFEFEQDYLGYGENIYYAADSDRNKLKYMHGARPVKKWYNESKKYSYDNPRVTGQPQVGHFTQTVWNDSKRIGCSRIYCSPKNGQHRVIVVCNYDPPGNFVVNDCKKYPNLCIAENVKKPTC